MECFGCLFLQTTHFRLPWDTDCYSGTYLNLGNYGSAQNNPLAVVDSRITYTTQQIYFVVFLCLSTLPIHTRPKSMIFNGISILV